MFRPVLRKTLLATGILFGSDAALAGNRVALVIGQSNYRAVVIDNAKKSSTPSAR